jgi:hypothetical protein
MYAQVQHDERQSVSPRSSCRASTQAGCRVLPGVIEAALPAHFTRHVPQQVCGCKHTVLSTSQASQETAHEQPRGEVGSAQPNCSTTPARLSWEQPSLCTAASENAADSDIWVTGV